MHPSITAQIVMLYYDDFAAAQRFYGETLGLKSIQEESWVHIYRCTEQSSIAVLRAGAEGTYHRAQAHNAVMISLVTDDVEGWYRRLRNAPDVRVLKEIYDSKAIPIRTFLLADPGGYALEIFQWRSAD